MTGDEVRELQDQRFAKLPKWAREWIRSLRTEVRNLKQRVAELSVGPEDSTVFIRHYSDIPDQPLGNDPNVTFVLGQDGKMPNEIHIRIERPDWRSPYLVVTGSGMTLRIEPQSSNSFRVSMDRS